MNAESLYLQLGQLFAIIPVVLVWSISAAFLIDRFRSKPEKLWVRQTDGSSVLAEVRDASKIQVGHMAKTKVRTYHLLAEPTWTEGDGWEHRIVERTPTGFVLHYVQGKDRPYQ